MWISSKQLPPPNVPVLYKRGAGQPFQLVKMVNLGGKLYKLLIYKQLDMEVIYAPYECYWGFYVND